MLDLDAQQLVLTVEAERAQKALKKALRGKKASPIGTRLTMTSRSSFFADRIIPPSMVSPISSEGPLLARQTGY